MFGLQVPLSLVSFWFPLLLSLQACREQKSTAHQFLLTYWLFYAVLNNASNYLQAYLGFLPLADVVELACTFLNMWLFYGHGCLVLAHYYLPDLLYKFTGCLSFAELDKRLITPGVVPMLNVLALTRPFSGIMAPILPRRRSSSNPRRLTLGTSLAQVLFSILDQGVDRFCYMDDPAELHARYLSNRLFLLVVSLAFSHQQQPKTRRRAVSRSNAGYAANINHVSHAGPQADPIVLSHRTHAQSGRGDQYPQPVPVNYGTETEYANYGHSENASGNNSGYGVAMPKQRDHSRKLHGRLDKIRFVSLGDMWTTRTERSRSLSDGDVERQAREQAMNGLPSVRVPPMYRG